MTKKWIFALPLAASLVCGVPPLAAQVTSGTIVGTVTDASGVVPGATITVREVNKGTTSSYVTDATGNYTASFLVPGTYAVEVNVQGFKKSIREGIILQVNQRARVDVTLEVGRIEETMTVVSSAPLVRADSSEVGTVIEERAIKELPLNGRNFATLVYLTPGITPGQAGENLSGASTFNPRGASNFNALGHQANANAWLIDGIDNNEYSFNTVIISPSVEQVREFKVLTGVFSAEFGRGAGVVSVSTKSGTNSFHGTAFEYLRDDAFDARNFFVRKTGAVRRQASSSIRSRRSIATSTAPPLAVRSSRAGPSSSPTTPGLQEKRGQVFVNTVPTARTRIGDFSDFRNPNGALIPIYDPLTTRPTRRSTRRVPVSATNPQFLRDQYPGNVIPADRINAVGRNVAEHLPAARMAPATSTTTRRRSTARRPTMSTRAASTTASRTTIRSSPASTTASSVSTRRRARPPAVCRRRRRRPPGSISDRSSPASRTRGSRRMGPPSTTRRSSRRAS